MLSLGQDQIDVIPVVLYTRLCHVEFRENLAPDILENLATMRSVQRLCADKSPILV